MFEGDMISKKNQLIGGLVAALIAANANAGLSRLDVNQRIVPPQRNDEVSTLGILCDLYKETGSIFLPGNVFDRDYVLTKTPNGFTLKYNSGDKTYVCGNPSDPMN